MIILNHRGLSPEKKHSFTENSLESFKYYLKKGYGIEFDLNFTKDNRIIIFHDNSLKRVTNGKNNELIRDLSFSEMKKIHLKKGRLCELSELLQLIFENKSRINAMHLKGNFQKKKYLDILINILKNYRNILNKLIIFDIKIETAKYLKNKIPNLLLAPSIAHKFDIKRYNKFTKKTLISINRAIKYKNFFKWAWLDEWDLKNSSNKSKKLYTKETFQILKSHGFKIALVSPELHSISPGLLGGESHEDAKNKIILKKRIKEILKLSPDAICTDYPENIK